MTLTTNPLDIFQEGFTPKEMADAKNRAVEGDRLTPAVNDIKEVLNRIIKTQSREDESWEVLAGVLKAFNPEIRTEIYNLAMKD